MSYHDIMFLNCNIYWLYWILIGELELVSERFEVSELELHSNTDTDNGGKTKKRSDLTIKIP